MWFEATYATSLNFLRSDFRQAGRVGCSIQPQHHKPVQEVVSFEFEFEISNVVSASFNHKEIDMQNYCSTLNTSISSSKLAIRIKAKFIALFTAASLVMMPSIGDHSA